MTTYEWNQLRYLNSFVGPASLLRPYCALLLRRPLTDEEWAEIQHQIIGHRKKGCK